MPASSLARRLFLTATAVSVVVLCAIALVLSTLYTNAVERSFDRRLNIYLKTLVADVASASAGQIPEPSALGDPLFDLPLSGWYWQIIRVDSAIPDVKRSRSAPESGMPLLERVGVPARPGGFREGYADGPDGQRLRIVERIVDLGEDGRFLVSVAGDATEIDDDSFDFDVALGITFAVIALAFLVTVLFQVRFGLSPLARMSERLAAIRSGRSVRLEGEFPREIAPLARELNALLELNREIVERARTHVGNLAHALKTPLSVLRNEADAKTDPLAVKVQEQVAVMHDQVQRHLERARIAARVATVGAASEVAPVVTGIARSMEKIHHERGLKIETRAENGVQFRGERQDLEEMLGNLVDNACKWAGSRVEVEALPAPSSDARNYFRLTVDDDGPGLPPEAQRAIPERGRRLDESRPGSGLGLSIVLELASLYGGKLELSTAPIGGLRAELTLPAA
jgi:signal transduction histidine kinase